jgi:L-iditol 2-dehydrogenase
MKALRFYGQNDIRLEDLPVPKPEPGGLLVKVEACAICGTDLKMFLKGDPRVPVGQTIGHEFVGEIVETGKDLRPEDFTVGERVTMATTIACGHCGFCRQGYTNRCEQVTPISRFYPGAFADYIAIPTAGVAGGNAVKVPQGVGDLAALAEPLSCVINAQALAGVKLGDTVVVTGFGPLGALQVQTARARGATRIFVIQRSETRRKLAEQFGADAVIDPTAADPVAEVMKRTDGMGADVAIVCAPSQAVQAQAFSMVRKGGMVNLFAGLPKGESEITVDTRLIHYRELFVSGGSDSTPVHVQQAVQMLAAGMISEKTITHRLPMSRFLEGLTLMKESKGLKVLLKPER